MHIDGVETKQDKATKASEQIIEEMDNLTLLGAAFDCMSDSGKAKFQKKVEKIIMETL